MLSVIVHDPEKKTKFYVSKISSAMSLSGLWGASKKRDVIQIRIPEAKIVNVGSMKGGGGLLKMFLPDEDIRNNIQDIDAIVKEQTKINNNRWFNNLLGEDTINAMFRPALNEASRTLTTLLSDYNEPNVYKDNVLTESQDAVKPGMSVMCDIVAQGVYFYPKKFGIRWVVKNIYVQSEVQEADTCQEDVVDKDAIEETWSTDVDAFHESVDQDIAKLMERIEYLRTVQSVVSSELKAAKDISNICGEWDAHLNKISKTLTGYYSGDC